jgi:Na+-translocating ferredoxin:NAD+ oxidoreductase subunit G
MVAPANEERFARPWRTASILLVVAVAGFGLVSLVHQATRDDIAAAARARQTAKFAEVLQGRIYDNDLLTDAIEVRDAELLGTPDALHAYRARRQGVPVAVVLEAVAPHGYSGAIGLLVGIAPDGTVLGVRVTRHRETPGLGDSIEAHRSNWIGRFAGRSLRDPEPPRWRVRKDGGDFDQFTGATITPRAVVAAVANALVYFERHREALLAPAVTMVAP